jgi:thiol-disulfide isomerase/thioredoxin
MYRFAAWPFAAIFLATTWQLAAAQALPKNFTLHDRPKAVAAINFDDVQGRSRSLADFKGKVLLLNIWATWCAPCRREMPTLDRLQTALGGPDFEVVPLSIDRKGIEAVGKFYAEIGVRNLAIYIDVSGQAARQVGAVGLPITLLVDRGGYEIGRIVGPAEWDTPEIAEYLSAKF